MRNWPAGFHGSTNDAYFVDVDGATRLSGDAYLAQLYAGPSLEMLRPVGQPTTFQNDFLAGTMVPKQVVLPTVPPGGPVQVQVRVWEREKGSCYEEARALGGKFGRSEVLSLTAGNKINPPVPLYGLQGFSLQAGLPSFNVGRIEWVERQPDGTMLWELTGEPGFRYVVEKSVSLEQSAWRPLGVVTNLTGRITFTDSPDPEAGTTFYRSRILD